jgi:LysR family glycine cleavage system transcriptional activator
MAAPSRLPPLNALRAFDAVARHLSFTRAAAELHVTPGAISHQIRTLEADLGVPLLHRLAREIQLTEAGTLLLPGTREAFRLLDDTVARLRGNADSGILTVSVAPSFAAKWLVLRLDRFADRNPGVDVRIAATERLTDFSRDDVDVAIRYGSGNYPGLQIERLVDNTVFPVCAPALAARLATPADLAEVILLHDDNSERDPALAEWPLWLKAAGITGVRADRGPRFGSSYLAIDAAVAGKGVALGKSVLVADDLAAGRLIRPFDFAMQTGFSFWVVSPPVIGDRPKVRAFRAWLREEIGAPSP